MSSSLSLINTDLIQLSNSNNNSFYKQNVKNFILGNFLKTKIQHIAWHIFHSFSVSYPITPSNEQMTMTKNFIKKIPTNLGIICSSCGGNNRDTFIATNDSSLNAAVTGRNNLIQFFCDYHTYINTTIRPQTLFLNYTSAIYDVSYITSKYTDNSYCAVIDSSYNINLETMFKTNSMDNFFIEFNKNIQEKISYTESNQYDFDISFSTIGST